MCEGRKEVREGVSGETNLSGLDVGEWKNCFKKYYMTRNKYFVKGWIKTEERVVGHRKKKVHTGARYGLKFVRVVQSEP